MTRTAAQMPNSFKVFRAVFGAFHEAKRMAAKAHKDWPALRE